MLCIEEIEDIIDEIEKRIFKANRNGTLDSLLESMGLSDLIKPKESKFESYKEGRIVIIGQTEVKKDMLRTIASKTGIDANRLEFCLDYEDAKSYNYRKLQYAPIYRVVMFGPVPHKTEGTANSSSVIAEMENTEGYPKIVRLMAGDTLKITKSNFRQALKQLLEEKYI